MSPPVNAAPTNPPTAEKPNENASAWWVYLLLMRHRKSQRYRLYIFRPPVKRLKGNGLHFLWSSRSDTRTTRLCAHIPGKTSMIKRERKTSFSGKARLVTPPNIPWVLRGGKFKPFKPHLGPLFSPCFPWSECMGCYSGHIWSVGLSDAGKRRLVFRYRSCRGFLMSW